MFCRRSNRLNGQKRPKCTVSDRRGLDRCGNSQRGGALTAFFRQLRAEVETNVSKAGNIEAGCAGHPLGKMEAAADAYRTHCSLPALIELAVELNDDGGGVDMMISLEAPSALDPGVLLMLESRIARAVTPPSRDDFSVSISAECILVRGRVPDEGGG
jgi:hypothetical protein